MATRLYRLLLWCLPRWFRQEFGAEMTGVFRASEQDAHGVAARMYLWLITIRDLVALGWRLRLEALVQDTRYALRMLRRSPAFALAAVGTLALGLGPTAVVANFAYQAIVAPLPFPEPDRLFRVWNARPERHQTQFPVSIPDYVDLRGGQTAFRSLAAHAGTSVALTGRGDPRQVTGVLTTSDLHDVLGVHPMIGRGLTPEDSATGAPPVMLLGAGLWRSDFGARADVVGQTAQLDGETTTIVGVLPDGLDFPFGSTNYWVPLTIDLAQANRGNHFLNLTGRLQPGVSAAQAEEALDGVARNIAATYPDTNAGLQTEVLGLKDSINGDAPGLLTVLGGAIAAVLLIACLNVASLLTVRASVRGSEMAVRTALGASSNRLRRQLRVEHLVLALAGGGLAAVLGFALHTAVISQRLLALPRTVTTFGGPALALLAGLAVIVGWAFAWIGAHRTAPGRAATSLLGAVRQTSPPGLLRARQALVVGEVAAALVLLVAAGLMLKSASRLAAVDPGFRTGGVLTFGIVLPGQTYPQQADRARFADRIVSELTAIPGVRQAAVGAYAPMGDMRATRRFAAADREVPPAGQEPLALDLPAGPGYFSVMGIRIADGRAFTDRDTLESPPVMVVSEAFARAVFPGERAVGKRVRFYSGRPGGTPPPTREIVGVVGDVRQDGVITSPIPQMYSPYAQTPWGFLSVFVQADTDAAALAPLVQRAVNRLDPMRPARDIKTIDAIVRQSTERQRAMMWMLIALGATALVLATVGLYGVAATAAAARSRELAIRAAVGADPRRLVRLVTLHGLRAAAVGTVLGIAGSLAAGHALSTFLFEVPPRDPAIIVMTSLLLLSVAGVAAWIPARRALRLNLAEVLRGE